MKQLLIPSKIKVGFQNRGDTYTKKLAYVIYIDQKGKLRKEQSWQSWRDQKIEPKDFTNEATTGFVLNKGVGGQRQSYGWNARNEYIRVYDPRDFEFEISVSNLLFILRECDCSKGKGLEGKFVYAWDGKELVLLPECSTDYQESKVFTDLQSSSVKSKEMIPGASYVTKKQEVLTYLGRLDYYYLISLSTSPKKSHKQHVFWNGKDFVFKDGLQTIATLHSEAITPDYAELIQKYNHSKFGSKIVKLYTKAVHQPFNVLGYYDRRVQQLSDGSFVEYYVNQGWEGRSEVVYSYRYHLQDGHLIAEGYHPPCHQSSLIQLQVADRLFAVLESGAEFRVNNSKLV